MASKEPQDAAKEGQDAHELESLRSGLDGINAPFKGGSKVSYLFSSAAAEEPIKHGLKRVPEGFIVIGQRAPGSIYAGASRSTTEHMYLQADTSGADVDLWFF